MTENNIITLCGIGSVISIVALYFISLSLVYPATDIGEITGHMTGSVVNITGDVKSIYVHQDGHMFVDMEDDTGEIRVILWKNILDELEMSGLNTTESIDEGSVLEVTGTVNLYRGTLEIIPIGSMVRII